MNMALIRVSVGHGSVRLSAVGMPPALHYRAATRTVHEVVNHARPRDSSAWPFTATPTCRSRQATGWRSSRTASPSFDPSGDQLGYERARAAFAAVAERAPREIVDALF